MATLTIPVPRLEESSEQDASDWDIRGTAEYDLVPLPFDAYRLHGGKDQLDEQEAESYRAWMEATEPGRAKYALDLFRDCGASVHTLPSLFPSFQRLVRG